MKTIDEDRYAQVLAAEPQDPILTGEQGTTEGAGQAGQVVDEVLATLGSLADEQFEVPPDILKAIKANKKAWKNFQAFSPSYMRIRIAFIDGARNRPQEFTERLGYFIEMTEKNRQFGFGGIEKYY